MTDTIRKLLQRAIDIHGAQIQIFKAVEEMGELTQALAKLAGNPDAPNPDYNQMVDHVAEEVADVRIMLEQLCMIFDVEDRAVRWRWHKLQRLKERLDQRERLSLQAQPEGQDAGETRGCAKHNGAGRKVRLDQMEDKPWTAPGPSPRATPSMASG